MNTVTHYVLGSFVSMILFWILFKLADSIKEFNSENYISRRVALSFVFFFLLSWAGCIILLIYMSVLIGYMDWTLFSKWLDKPLVSKKSKKHGDIQR